LNDAVSFIHMDFFKRSFFARKVSLDDASAISFYASVMINFFKLLVEVELNSSSISVNRYLVESDRAVLTSENC
jgi:hypothetical protein